MAYDIIEITTANIVPFGIENAGFLKNKNECEFREEESFLNTLKNGKKKNYLQITGYVGTSLYSGHRWEKNGENGKKILRFHFAITII